MGRTFQGWHDAPYLTRVEVILALSLWYFFTVVLILQIRAEKWRMARRLSLARRASVSGIKRGQGKDGYMPCILRRVLLVTTQLQLMRAAIAFDYGNWGHLLYSTAADFVTIIILTCVVHLMHRLIRTLYSVQCILYPPHVSYVLYSPMVMAFFVSSGTLAARFVKNREWYGGINLLYLAAIMTLLVPVFWRLYMMLGAIRHRGGGGGVPESSSKGNMRENSIQGRLLHRIRNFITFFTICYFFAVTGCVYFGLKDLEDMDKEFKQEPNNEYRYATGMYHVLQWFSMAIVWSLAWGPLELRSNLMSKYPSLRQFNSMSRNSYRTDSTRKGKSKNSNTMTDSDYKNLFQTPSVSAINANGSTLTAPPEEVAI